MPMPEAAPAQADRSPRPGPTQLAPQVLRIVGVAALVMFLCEWLRQQLPASWADWVPPAVTIVFSSLAAALFGWDVLRRQQRLHDRLHEEAQVRQRLEERERQLDEHNRQLEALTRQLAEESEQRRQTTEALRETELRYRILVEHAPECISVLDASTGRFMDVNSHAVELYGLEREQLFQTGPIELSPPCQPDGTPSVEAARQWIQQALDGGTPVFEWTHRHPVRGDFPCEVRLVCMPAGDRLLVRGSLTDISERKRIEQELRRSHDELEKLVKERTAELAQSNEALRAEVAERQRSETHWRQLVEHAPDIILSMLRDGTILYVNHVVAGMTIEEVVGSNARRYVPAEQYDGFLALLETVFTMGQPASYEGFGAGPHGSLAYYATRLHPVKQDGQVVAATMITNDITERKQMEESLRRERDFIAAVLDSARILVMVVDPRGHILRLSRACELTLGCSLAEVQSQPIWELLAVPQEAALVQAAFASLAATGKFPPGLLDHWRTRTGPPRLLEWTAVVVSGADGRPEHLICTGLDITERERARLALSESDSPQRLLLEQVPAILWTTDRDLTFTTGVGAGLARLGLQPSQAQTVGTSLYTYFHTDDPRNPMVAAHQRTLEGERSEFEMDWLGRTFQSLVEPLRDAQGEIIGTVGIALDVTERKQSEAALRESEERLQLTLEAANIGLWSWQIPSNTIYYSPRWKAQLGYEDHELLNRYEEWTERLHSDDRERMQETVRNYLAHPWPGYEAEFRLRHRDGTYRWMLARAMLFADAEGRPYRMLGCHLDITERKHIEESLRAREAQLRNLGDNLPHGMIFQLLKRPDGSREVPYMSAGVQQLFGVTADEVTTDAEAAYAMILPGDLPAIQAMEEESERELTPFDCVFRTRNPSGEIKWFHCRSAPHRLPDGSTLWNGVTVDETAWHRAEEQLRASEKRFRALIENTSDCVTLLDEHGFVLYVSPGITRMLGYRVEEFVGSNSFDPLHPDDVTDSQARFAELLQQPGGEARKRIRYRHRDGSWRWIEAVGSNLLAEPAVGALVVNFRDVTENQHAEEALYQREQEVRALVDHSPDVIARYDRELRYRYINPAVEKATGLPPSHYLGKTNAEAGLPAATVEHWEAVIRQVFVERVELHAESEYPAAAGPIYYESRLVPEFSTDGEVESVLVVSRDITERKRAEQALRRSQASLEAAQGLARLGSWEFDPQTDTGVWSKEMYQLYHRDPTLGPPKHREFLDLVHPDDVGLVAQGHEQANHSAQPVHVEYRTNPACGPLHYLYCTLYQPGGSASTSLLTGTVLNITERKLAENRIQAALREKETLLKEVHHRVKNNLAIVDSLLNMQEGKVQEPAAVAILRDCRNRIHSMAAIHDFLYRSKNFSRIDVAAYLQTLCTHLFRSFGAVERRIELSLDLANLELDLEYAVPLGLLVNELVTNALKHAFPENRAGRVRVRLSSAGADALALGVSDDGVGLPAETELLQTRSLGLRLVQTLTRQIRGTLDATRAGGTSFTIVFPQSPAKEPVHA